MSPDSALFAAAAMVDSEQDNERATSDHEQDNERLMSDMEQANGHAASDDEQEDQQVPLPQNRLQVLFAAQQQLHKEAKALQARQERNLQLILREINGDGDLSAPLSQPGEEDNFNPLSPGIATADDFSPRNAQGQSLFMPGSKRSKKLMISLPAPVAPMSAATPRRDEERIRQAMAVTRSAGGKRSRIFLDDDDEFEGNDMPSANRRKSEPVRTKAGPKQRSVDDDFKIPKHPNPGKFPHHPISPYPIISPKKEYSMIVQNGAGAIIELHCKFCNGNVTQFGGPIKGVAGIFAHIKVGHKRTYSWEWVVKHCVNKVLSKKEIDEVKKGEYLVLRHKVKQYDLNKMGEIDEQDDDDEGELSA